MIDSEIGQEENITPIPTSPREAAAANPVQDIDPAQWLRASNDVVTGYVQTRAGRLKIAALTEKEADLIRKGSEQVDPSNPRNRRVGIKKLRLSTVAASLNKAYGYAPGDPRFINPNTLEETLSGEITTIVQEISELSGFVEDNQGNNPGDFF